MNDQTKQENLNRKAEEAARAAVEEGENIHEAVRDITLEALSDGHLDVKKMREVVQAVLQGAGIGTKKKGAQTGQSLREAMAGVDEALAKSAEASKLAIEEAAGHIKDFGTQDLNRALDDLRTLEDMFLDTVKSIAKASDDTVRDSLNDLAQHARNSGTTVGSVAKKAVETLSRQMEQSVQESVNAGADTALNVGAQLSRAAAGFLEGIAETLKKAGSNKKEQ